MESLPGRILRHLTPAGSGSGFHHGLTHFSGSGPIKLELRPINKNIELDIQTVGSLDLGVQEQDSDLKWW